MLNSCLAILIVLSAIEGAAIVWLARKVLLLTSFASLANADINQLQDEVLK